jgi:endo-1,4-beta-xylanase
VTDRYDGQIDTWDVVNEAVADNAELRANLWLESLGEESIADAFRWAAERTDATLLYNDYSLTYNEGKQDRVYALPAELIDDGVPIDGVGIQMHCLDTHPTPKQIRETVERPDDLEAAQAAYYRQTVEACLDAGVGHITLWGVTDENSWITKWRDYPETYTQCPMLFDEDGQKKQSYEVVASALQEYT